MTTITDCLQQCLSLTAESAIAKDFQVQITQGGIDQLEAYAHAVIETVSNGFISATDGVHNHTMSTMDDSINAAPECLRKQWNLQSKLQRYGQLTPNGLLTGCWKPSEWAVSLGHIISNDGRGVHIQKQKKHPGCRKSLLPELDSLVLNFAAEMRMSCDNSGQHCTSASLWDVVCPQYARPTINLLRLVHLVVESLLPKGDCKDWEVVAMAWHYYWHPRETKVILLAEAHAFTPKERMYGPGLDKGMLHNTYFGPRGFVSLVYCLSYGKNESLSEKVIDKGLTICHLNEFV